METSRFHRDISVDLRSERDNPVFLGHSGCYLLYNAIITRKKKEETKSHFSERRVAVRHLILSTATTRKQKLTISPLWRYFLLSDTACFLNQLTAVGLGIFLLVTVMAVEFA